MVCVSIGKSNCQSLKFTDMKNLVLSPIQFKLRAAAIMCLLAAVALSM